jgi:hypothetical protein
LGTRRTGAGFQGSDARRDGDTVDLLDRSLRKPRDVISFTRRQEWTSFERSGSVPDRRTISAVWRTVALLCWFVSIASVVRAQTAGARNQEAPGESSQPTWSLRASAATYLLPDEENYIQPTLAADRGALHLESRFNYEDRNSVSGFVGWNVQVGQEVSLQLTPMFGAVGGDTDGIIPALELTFVWKRLDLYSEGEYVIDVDDLDNRFFYNWSEAAVWVTDWIRGGLVAQRTRAYDSPRDIERGFLVGTTVSSIEGTFYLFRPGSDDRFLVIAIGVTF